MSVFKDSLGREWLVRLSAPVINDVRKELGVNLVSLSDPIFPKFADDIALAVNCLWVLCRKQATSSNVTDEQFGEALVGDCLDGACSAITEAILDFFPKSTRDMLRALSRQDMASKTAATEILQTALENEPLAMAMLENQKAQMRKLLATLMPANGPTGSLDSVAVHQTIAP